MSDAGTNDVEEDVPPGGSRSPSPTAELDPDVPDERRGMLWFEWGRVVWGGSELHAAALDVFASQADGGFKARSSSRDLPIRADIARRNARRAQRSLRYFLYLAPPAADGGGADDRAAADGELVFRCAADPAARIESFPKSRVLRRGAAAEGLSTTAVAARGWGTPPKGVEARELPPLSARRGWRPPTQRAVGEWVVVSAGDGGADVALVQVNPMSGPSTLPGGGVRGVAYYQVAGNSAPEEPSVVTDPGVRYDGCEVAAAARVFIDHTDGVDRPVLDYVATRAALRGRGLCAALFRVAVWRCRAECPQHGGVLWLIALSTARVVSHWERAGLIHERDRALAERYNGYSDGILMRTLRDGEVPPGAPKKKKTQKKG